MALTSSVRLLPLTSLPTQDTHLGLPQAFWKTCQSELPTSQPPEPLDTTILGLSGVWQLRKEGLKTLQSVGYGQRGLSLRDKVEVMTK